jgi:hypothetical protein
MVETAGFMLVAPTKGFPMQQRLKWFSAVKHTFHDEE